MWCDLDKPEQIVHLLADADIVDKIFWLYPKKLMKKIIQKNILKKMVSDLKMTAV